MSIIAVVRIRGLRKVNPDIRKTLEYLNLSKPNYCVLLGDTKQNLGMLNKVRDYVAYGEVNEDFIFGLLKKRGKKGRKLAFKNSTKEELTEIVKSITSGKKKLKDFANGVFKLRPPKKGFNSIKEHYPRGDLGKHDDVSLLLRRMMWIGFDYLINGGYFYAK